MKEHAKNSVIRQRLVEIWHEVFGLEISYMTYIWDGSYKSVGSLFPIQVGVATIYGTI